MYSIKDGREQYLVRDTWYLVHNMAAALLLLAVSIAAGHHSCCSTSALLFRLNLSHRLQTKQIPVKAIPNEEKITIRDLVVVNRDFFFHDSRQKDHESRHDFFPKKNKITIRNTLSWFDICLIKALRNPSRTNGIRTPV